jgi:hypothetical protein
MCHDFLLFLLQPSKRNRNKSICILIIRKNDDMIKWSGKRVAEGLGTLPLFLCKICGNHVANCVGQQNSISYVGASTPAAFEPQGAPTVHRLVNAGKVNASSLGEQRTEL